MKRLIKIGVQTNSLNQNKPCKLQEEKESIQMNIKQLDSSNFILETDGKVQESLKMQNTWRITTTIQTSSNFCIFEGMNRNKEKVMIKFSCGGALQNEINVYNAIKGRNKFIGFPTLKSVDDVKGFSVLVLDYIGDCLHDKLKALEVLPVRLKTVLLFGMQMVQRLAALHDVGFVHGNLNLYNIFTGHDKSRNEDLIYLSDFMYARSWKSKKGGHIRLKRRRDEIPIPLLFCSIAFHKGLEIVRKDDIESLVYLMVFLARRKLPWQYTPKFVNSPFDDDIKAMKIEPIKCGLFQGLPKAFESIWEITQTMNYEDQPRYDTMISLLIEGIEEIGMVNDGKLVWTY